MRVVYGLGSSLGDRLAHLQAAVDHLAPVAVSAVYETEPVGGPPGSPPYLNAVAVVDLAPDTDPLAPAVAAEATRGRERAVRWGPRTLDVDVLAVGACRSDAPRLTLPHPRAHERAFVLVPWAEVDPAGEVPGRGAVAALLAALPPAARAGLRRRDDLVLRLPAAPAPP